ncbi:MAG: IS4 family transposase [Clostridia bacterium]|nr:IS4 family transposase [Clostridia bacterium]
MYFVKKIDESFSQALKDIVSNRKQYVRNPLTDFTRKRKMNMRDVISQIHSMTGGSLQKELYDWSKIKKISLTASAFVQQRSKILSDAFKDIFYHFNSYCNDSKKYRGYRLIGVDGTDVSCPRNPDSPNFITTSQSPEGVNRIHVNALYDLCNHTYVDILCQPPKQADERAALIEMLHRKALKEKTLFVFDRGYESYNLFAHIINTENADFVCRVRQSNSGMSKIKTLPMKEFDIDITFDITTTQTNEDKLQGRIWIQTGSKKGKINSPKTRVRQWDFPSPYSLKLRVVRFLLDSGEYETLITSLSREEFSLQDLKKLYHERWNIEISFRDLKYPIGLTYLHSKKDDLILQEIYAAVTMYNYCSRIASSVDISRYNGRKHAYKVNLAMAIHICKRFCLSNTKKYKSLLNDINRYVIPLRPGRRDERKMRPKRFVGFIYRVAA